MCITCTENSLSLTLSFYRFYNRTTELCSDHPHSDYKCPDTVIRIDLTSIGRCPYKIYPADEIIWISLANLLMRFLILLMRNI